MDLKLKHYQKIKIKKYLENISFFSLYHTPKKASKDLLDVEQKLKNLGFHYHKVSNRTTIKVIQSSIYKNFDKTFCGTVILLYPMSDNTEFNFKDVNNQLKVSFICLALKVNNKLYSSDSVKRLTSTSYKKNMCQMINLLNKYIKISHTWTFSNSK